MLNTAIQSCKPIIFDADALNLLSKKTDLLLSKSKQGREKFIFTPHPGEAARLLSSSTLEIQKNRLSAIQALQQKWGGHFLLKGSGSLVIHPDSKVALCHYGNPGMASGGMGDILSGIIGALVGQGFKLSLALELAVCLHAKAADLAAETLGQRGLLASDIIPYARSLLNKK